MPVRVIPELLRISETMHEAFLRWSVAASAPAWAPSEYCRLRKASLQRYSIFCPQPLEDLQIFAEPGDPRSAASP
jgi:hypothetical protein